MRTATLLTLSLLVTGCAAHSAERHASAPAAPGASTAEPTVEYLSGSRTLPSNLPFSEAVRVGNTLYLSGQIGVVPGTTELVAGGMAEETRQIMRNIAAILEANGYRLSELVKCTVMLADLADWPEFNEVYASFFDGRFPARSAFGANGLALGAAVEVECIAAR